MDKELLFSLDIGTRSVIGIVAEKKGDALHIIATERSDHNTRAMMDGQIHDVPQVAAIIQAIKEKLEQKVGELKAASVAAAGRALYTVTAEAELAVSDIITVDDEHTLDYAAIQTAQKKLLNSSQLDDPSLYYCVGYSPVSYRLDGTQLKTLVGQRGKKAQATVIATFLPKQVIDSIESALNMAGLQMQALTLEPIAAINVLIPPTMRHLNLVLVDIGAGTSDVAITKNNTVIAYGMVPTAGDEITEALSQRYLLDFNVAEQLKRRLNDALNPVPVRKPPVTPRTAAARASAKAAAARVKKLTFHDILGMEYSLTAKEILSQLNEPIGELAQSIAAQIVTLNGEAPQAVLLVGGGALTPQLSESLAAALDIPLQRVAVRTPERINGISDIPADMRKPDYVTPLGILNIASLNTLNFVNVKVNGQEYHLFNIARLSVSDALLAAGIGLKQLGGKPGLGLTASINGQAKFFPGTMGKSAHLTLNGADTALNAPLNNGDVIEIKRGVDGKEPVIHLSDVVDLSMPLNLNINEEDFLIQPDVKVNGQSAPADYCLQDRDEITFTQLSDLGSILKSVGYDPGKRHFSYTINGTPGFYDAFAQIRVNDTECTLNDTVEDGDRIACIEAKPPRIGELLGIEDIETSILVRFNGSDCRIPTAVCEITMNDLPVNMNTLIRDNATIRYSFKAKESVIVSDVLLAAGFQPPNAFSNVTIEITLNNEPTEYTTAVNNGDAIDVVIKQKDVSSSLS